MVGTGAVKYVEAVRALSGSARLRKVPIFLVWQSVVMFVNVIYELLCVAEVVDEVGG